jgi:hypothetical protein
MAVSMISGSGGNFVNNIPRMFPESALDFS